MKKTLKKLTALLLSLVMVLGCIPSFINEVNAESFDISFSLEIAVRGLSSANIAQYTTTTSQIVKDKSSLSAKSSNDPDTNVPITSEPTLVGITTSPNGKLIEPYTQFVPGKRYYLLVKYDLTGYDLSNKTDPNILIDGHVCKEDGTQLVRAKDYWRDSITINDYKFTETEKSVTFAVAIIPDINVAICNVNLDDVLYYDANKITFKASGRQLPDYAELSVYKGDLSALTVSDIRANHSIDHVMDLYSYNTKDRDFLESTVSGFTNYGDNSVSADRTKGVYTFVTEDDVEKKFDTEQKYTFIFVSRLGKWNNSWIVSQNKFYDNALTFTTTEDPVLNITYKNDFSDEKIATTPNKFMSDSNVISEATEDYIDYFDYYFDSLNGEPGHKYEEIYDYNNSGSHITNFARLFAEPIKLELQQDKHLTDYQVYLNGREVKYIKDLETKVTQGSDLETLKYCLENSTPFIFEEDGNYWLYIVTNMLITQQPTKENGYSVAVKALNTSDYYGLGYRWQRKTVDDSYKISDTEGIIDVAVTGRDTARSPKPAYKDSNDKFYLCTFGSTNSFTDDDIASNGLIGIQTNSDPLTFESTIVLKTTGTNNRKFIPGDKLVFKSPKVDNKVDKIQMTVRGTHDTFQWGNCENVYSYYEYTLQSKDIDEINNTVTIDIKSVYNEHYNTQYNIRSGQIKSDGVIWNDIPNDTRNALQTKNVGETYRCNIFVGDRELLGVFSNPVTIEAEPEPAPTGGSSSYKAVDKDKTAEKITGTGRKGAKRVIIPKEGRKVQSVIVTDKKGNKIEVTPEKDGTYSFIQPGSDVDVKVNYKLRLIELTIGSLDASVDDVHHLLDVVPQVRNDRTMLPIRFVAENLGAQVDWDEKDPDTALITKDGIKIEITLGSDIAKVNGKEYKLDAVAFAENDRTYLPVRFVSENLNAIVEWNEANPMDVKIYER